jgi:hypothetical protein
MHNGGLRITGEIFFADKFVGGPSLEEFLYGQSGTGMPRAGEPTILPVKSTIVTKISNPFPSIDSY